MSKSIDISNRIKDIVNEAKNIINNNIEDESKLRKMIGQLLIENIKHDIDNWNDIYIPNVFKYKIILYEIFEDIFNEIIPKKLLEYNCHVVEFRNIGWGDNIEFCISNPKIKSLSILDKNNILFKKDLINSKVSLEMNSKNILLNYLMYKFLNNETDIKSIAKSVFKDIQEYLDKQIDILQDNVQIVNLFVEKPIKVGFEYCLVHEMDGVLCLGMKIGVGMLGGSNE